MPHLERLCLSTILPFTLTAGFESSIDHRHRAETSNRQLVVSLPRLSAQ